MSEVIKWGVEELMIQEPKVNKELFEIIHEFLAFDFN